jgi:hypothetical protein
MKLAECKTVAEVEALQIERARSFGTICDRHGSLWRSCYLCDLAEEERISELLRERVAELETALRHEAGACGDALGKLRVAEARVAELEEQLFGGGKTKEPT